MRKTVTEWTNCQCDLDDHDDSLAAKLLTQKIEERTFGRQWSQEVAIALTKDEEAMLAKARQAHEEVTADG